MSDIDFHFVGTVHSPYKEKFAVPRQPGLVPAAKGRIEFLPPFAGPDAVRDLEQFSHIWVLFVFHGTQEQGWKPLVRPPRLGGNAKTGVFSTRSTFRPNPIGMSAVKLDGVERDGGKAWLHISGMDLLDGTPVLDVKPYVPYSDSLADAGGGFASGKPTEMAVVFTPAAERLLIAQQRKHPELREFIHQVLSQDPRPAYKVGRDERRQYGVRLYDFNVVWEVVDDCAQVIRLEEIKE